MQESHPIAGASGEHAGRGSSGRRERKKDAVRQALRVAALRLVAERGLASVTVEEITDAADVSVRTFFNYFSCKEDALIGPSRELGERIAEAVAGLAPAEAPLQSLHAMAARFAASVESSPERRADWVARMQLVRDYPAELLPRQLAAFADLEAAVAGGIAARLGLDVEVDIYPSLLCAVAMTAMRIAFTHWRDGESETPLSELVDQAFDLLATGLGESRSRPRSVPVGSPRAESREGGAERSRPRSPAVAGGL